MSDLSIEGKKINGRFIAKLYEDYIRQTLSDFKQKLEDAAPGLPIRQPSIVSFCNQEDPSSVKYTQLKREKAEELGIKFNIIYITPKTPFEFAKQKVLELNESGHIDGIMVQLPITDNLQNFKENLVELIIPEKDVDGLTEQGRKIFLPATIEAVLQILDTRNHDLTGKIIAVVGSEGEIGRPLVEQLQKRHPKQLIKVDLQLPDTSVENDLLSADYIFSSTGVRSLIKSEYLKTGVIVYDIGLGDIDPSVYEIASEYTPEIGGVGPNTVVALMRNVLKSYIQRMTRVYQL